MTALPEGEHAYSSNEQLIEDQKLSSKINIDPGSPDPKDANPEDDSLLKFLEQNDLTDVIDIFVASKLTLDHLKQVERDDLEALCSDLNLSSSQKIRVKHAIKTLQKKKKKKTNPKANSHRNPSRIEIKESGNGGLKQQILAKVEQVFSSDIAAEMEGSPKSSSKQKLDEKVRRLKSKIVIVGEAAVGKTTLQKAIMGYRFEEGSKATFAVNSVHHKSRFDHDDQCLVVDYEIFDTPGLDRFRDIITLYLRGALAVIVVYDVTKPQSFLKAKWWIDYLENHASGYDKVILIANKIDIELNADDNEDEEDQNEDDGKEAEVDPGSVFHGVSTAGKSDDCIITDGRMYATEHGIAFLEISAKYRDNVNVMMSWIDKQCKLKVEQNPELVEKEQNIKLHEPLLGGNTERGFMDRFDLNGKCC